jgi:hypothetical protein
MGKIVCRSGLGDQSDTGELNTRSGVVRLSILMVVQLFYPEYPSPRWRVSPKCDQSTRQKGVERCGIPNTCG